MNSLYILKTMRRRDEKGFTMLEVLFAIAIMGITILPLLGLMAMAPSLHVQREQQMRSAFLAQLMVEDVKFDAMADFSSDYSDTGDFSDYLAKYMGEADRLDYQGFKYTVTDEDDPDVSNMKIITVDVGYLDAVLVTVNFKVTKRN